MNNLSKHRSTHFMGNKNLINTAGKRLRTLALTSLLISSIGVSQNSVSIPLNLPDQPLFALNSVAPNIFLALDDSGSMTSEILPSSLVTFAHHLRTGFPLVLLSGEFYVSSTSPQMPLIPRQGWCYTEPVGGQEFGVSTRCQTAPTPQFYDDAAALGTFSTRSRSALYKLSAGSKMFWSHHYNATFYNPETTYTPWIGVDRQSNPYTNADPTAARINPYLRSRNRNIQNLTQNYTDYLVDAGTITGFYPARYYRWENTNTASNRTDSPYGGGDLNRDSEFFRFNPNLIDNIINGIDVNDTFDLVEIRPSTPSYTNAVNENRNNRVDCVAAPTCSYNEEMQNFANWFSYYRNREYVLKRAMSELISESTAYVGMATMNERRRGLPVADMNVPNNKDLLLDSLFRIDSRSNTPTRLLLRNIGRYFDDQSRPLGDPAGGPFDRLFPRILANNVSSPIQSQANGGECQQNFVVLVTDGGWTFSGSNIGVGNTDNLGTEAVNYDGGPHADAFSDTLADIAMLYYEQDLSTLDNRVPESRYYDPTSGITYTDDNPQQHLSTYAVAFGIEGSGIVTPPDHDVSTPPPAGGWLDPTRPFSQLPTKVDDLQHAAFNGRGAYLNASDPDELIESLNAALSGIGRRSGLSGSALAINSTILRTTARIFQATFDSSDWSGELTAFSLNPDGTLNQEVWTANDNLPSHSNRNIFTSINLAGTAFAALPPNNSLSTAIGPLQVSNQNYNATDIIDYIRGDQAKEGTGPGELRIRTKLLGDIVGSSPISIGYQDFGYNLLLGVEGTSYATFLADKVATFTNNTSGEPETVVYVGGNDGMLHAFHDSASPSTDGNELFAYIPSIFLSRLKNLASPNYRHEFFLNGNLFVGDACIDNSSGSACTWKSILVGTLGEGGRTVFALDVTDPFNFNATDILWEYKFDDSRPGTSNSLGMGFSKGTPLIARLHNGKWGVVFGNGYNSDDEQSQIFILDIADGTEIAVFNTKSGSPSATNGMGPPLVLDENNDRIADIIYAGDLLQGLYKFDITNSNAASWGTVFRTASAVALPIYRLPATTSGSGITIRPTVAVDEETNRPGFNILFGTGRYLSTDDAITRPTYPVERIYSIWDDNIDNALTSRVSGLSRLVQQSIVEEVDSGGRQIRIVSDNTVNYTGPNAKKGWYMDLLSPTLTPTTGNGERVIADPLVRFNRAIFTTYIPSDSPCDPGGTSVLMEVDALSGARTEDSVLDINDDGIVDNQDFVTDSSGNRVPASGIYIPGTLTSPAVISLADPSQEAKRFSSIEGDISTIIESTNSGAEGRQSWRQLR